MFSRLVIFLLFSCISAFTVASQAFTVFTDFGKQGLKDGEGKIVVPAIYDLLGWSNGETTPMGELIGFKKQDKWGIINTQSKVLQEAIYYRLQPLNDQYIKAAIKGSFSNHLFYGLINRQGKVVLSCNFFDIEPAGSSFIVSNYQTGSIYKGLYRDGFELVIPVEYSTINEIDHKTYAAQRNSGKWDLYTIDGLNAKLALDDYKMRDGDLVVKSQGKYGIIDLNSLTIKQPIQYKSIANENIIPFPSWDIKTLNLDTAYQLIGDSLGIVGELFITHVNGNQEVMINSQQLFGNEEVELKYASNGFLIVKQQFDAKWKLLTTQGNVVITEQDSIHFDGVFFTALANNQWQVYNRFGRKLSIKSFDQTGSAISNLLPVKKLDYWTVMDFQGELLSAPKYDSIISGLENRLVVDYLGSIGVIDAFGDWILKPLFDEVNVWDDIIVARKSRKHAVYSHQGKELFTLDCDQFVLKHDYIAFRQDSLWGIMTLKGTYVADPIYREVGKIGEFLYGKSDYYVALFDLAGRQIADANDHIEDILGENENLYRVIIDGKVGYIDANARLRIANRYDDGGLLFENRLPVKLLGRWGYVDRYEQLIIQPTFEFAGNFDQGVAIARKNKKLGLIDLQGSVLLDFEYDEIFHHPGRGYVLKTPQGSWGATDEKGNIILTPNYEFIREASNGLLMVNRDQKWGIIDQRGYTRIPFEYDDISQYQDYFLMKRLPKE